MRKKNGKLNFGDNAVVSDDGTVTTPIVENDSDREYIFILEGITVGNSRFDYYSTSTNLTSTNSNASKEEQEGNMYLDSGTLATSLPTKLYKQVRPQ